MGRHRGAWQALVSTLSRAHFPDWLMIPLTNGSLSWGHLVIGFRPLKAAVTQQGPPPRGYSFRRRLHLPLHAGPTSVARCVWFLGFPWKLQTVLQVKWLMTTTLVLWHLPSSLYRGFVLLTEFWRVGGLKLKQKMDKIHNPQKGSIVREALSMGPS